MKKAVDHIFEHAEQFDRYSEPQLNEMFAITDHFYRSVVEQAFYASQDEKKSQRGKKRLAKEPPKNSLKVLAQVFEDKREWPKMMRRSKKLTERLRKDYLQKLKRKFKEVMPRVNSGEISPDEAKSQMMDTWHASKARVETIFRTETTNYFAQTQVKFFEEDDEIIGFLFDSIRDTSRTEICRSRHGLVYKPNTAELHENTPALHYNCRSHLIALANTPENRKMVNDPSRDPANKKVEPLPPGWRK